MMTYYLIYWEMLQETRMMMITQQPNHFLVCMIHHHLHHFCGFSFLVHDLPLITLTIFPTHAEKLHLVEVGCNCRACVNNSDCLTTEDITSKFIYSNNDHRFLTFNFVIPCKTTSYFSVQDFYKKYKFYKVFEHIIKQLTFNNFFQVFLH